MAIYHLTVSVGSRSGGQSAKAKSEYITRAGKYKRGRDDLGLVKSGNMPVWVKEARHYWDVIDIRERANGTLFRQVEVALPLDLSRTERADLAQRWAADVAEVEGGRLPYTLAVHEADGNPHAHLMLSERINDGQDRTPETWCKRAPIGARKVDLGRASARQAWLKKTREQWADLANSALERAGHTARIDHRSLEAQGIERLPGIHIGPEALAMERRGIQSERGTKAIERQKIINKFDSLSEELRGEQNAISNGSAVYSKEFGHSGRTDRTFSAEHGSSCRRLEGGSFPEQSRNRGSGSGNASGFIRNGEEIEPSSQRAYTGSSSSSKGCNRDRQCMQQEYMADVARSSYGGNVTLDCAAARVLALSPSRPSSRRRRNNMAQNLVDRTTQAVRRQLSAMGCDMYEIGIRDQDSGKMMHREWSAPEIEHNLPWLRRMNARGNDIYIRPHKDERHNLVLVDDVDGVTIETMAEEGLEAACVLETSHKNLQAWLRVENADSSEIRAEIGRLCVDEYGADPGCIGHHYGRLAGFTNRKPSHEKQGRCPYILCRQSSGDKAKASSEIMAKASARLGIRKKALERRRRLKTIQGAPNYANDATGRYRAIYGSLMRQYGKDIDESRADFAVARSMAMSGYEPEEIGAAMAEASPGLAERHNGEDYVKRTLAAVERLPEVQVARRGQAQEKEGPGLGF